jgi:hypothetical protein
MDNMELSLAVCSDHFIEEQFINSFSSRSKEDAVPFVFPVVRPSFDKSCMFSTQEHEPLYTGKHKTFFFLLFSPVFGGQT